MKNRKTISLWLLLLIPTMLAPAQRAGAFWKGVGEWSGPGPWWAMDWVFPWSLASTDLNLQMAIANRDLLNDMLGGDPVIPELSDNMSDFLRNQEHVQFYGTVLDVEELRNWRSDRDDSELIDELIAIAIPVSFTPSSIPESVAARQALPDEDKGRLAQTIFQILDTRAWQRTSRILESKIRTYGAGWFGLFGSQSALPRLADPLRDNENTLNNWFFTLATGYAVSLDNDLDLPSDFGDRVHWITVYPALERRFGANQPDSQKAEVKSNWFWNVGPAFHYVFGEAFDNLTRVSARSRFGRRYRGVYFGVEVDYFVPVMSHAELGAVDDFRNVRFSYAGFFGLELRRILGK